MGKKLISIAVAVFILVSLIIPVSAGTEIAVLELAVDSAVLKKDSTVKISVTVKNVEDLFGIQFKLSYPKDILKYQTTSISDKYDTYESQKIDEDMGEVSNVLIMRRDVSDKSFKNSVELASFTFKALKPGKPVIALSDIKAISSETFINAAGYKDMKTIPLSLKDSIQIEVISEQSGGSDSGSGGENSMALVDELKRIEEVSASNINHAITQMNNLLDRLNTNISSGDKHRVADAVNKLSGELLKISWTAVNGNGKELNDVLKQYKELMSKSAAKGIPVTAAKEIGILIGEGRTREVKFSGSDLSNLAKEGFNIRLISDNIVFHIPSGTFDVDEKGHLAITVTSDIGQTVTLNHAVYTPLAVYEIGAEVINGDGRSQVEGFGEKTAVEIKYRVGGINSDLLGLYAYNETTGMWDYIRSAKHDRESGSFSADINNTGKYAVIEFKKEYTDIGETYSAAQNAIYILSARHIVSGISPDQYAPKKDLTRAEFTALIVKALDIDLTGYKGSFSDVKSGKWYTEYVEAAYGAGLASGVGDQKFNPDGKITREQMATLIVKAYEYKNGKLSAGSDKFADDHRISGWAAEFVYKARAAGLLSGTGNNMLSPDGITSRADAAVMILKLISKLEL